MEATLLKTRRLPRRGGWTLVVVNPTAGAGRAGRERERIAQALAAGGMDITVAVTRQPGEARGLARRAAQGGADTVIAVGGDGTIHEVANGLRDASTTCGLGVIDCGTGSGFAESLSLPDSRDGQLALLEHGRQRRIDLGRLACVGDDDRTVLRVFASECQVGIGAAVCARLGGLGKRMGGRVAFKMAALLASLRYEATPLEITLDDEAPFTQRLLGVVVANGARCGGGMRLAPTARLDDGRLDVVLIPDMPLVQRARFLRRVYRGTHVDGVRCRARTVRRLRIRAVAAVPVAADGEVLGTTPLDIEVLPRAMAVLGA